jgi:biotin carboxyl carrier protein
MHLTQLVISKGDFNLSLSSSANGGIKTQVLQGQGQIQVRSGSTPSENQAVKAAEQNEPVVAVATETIDAIMAGTFYRAADAECPAVYR